MLALLNLMEVTSDQGETPCNSVRRGARMVAPLCVCISSISISKQQPEQNLIFLVDRILLARAGSHKRLANCFRNTYTATCQGAGGCVDISCCELKLSAVNWNLTSMPSPVSILQTDTRRLKLLCRQVLLVQL